MYPLCYFVLTVNLNKRLTSILREVNINGYNTCILSIIGATYLYIWGAFTPYDTKAQITHQLSKVFCTYARASSVAMYCKRGRISEEDWFFSRNWLSFLFWHWSSIRVLRIKPIWENRLVFKWGKYFSGLMFKLTRGCLVFCWWWEDYRQWTMSYHPRSANSQGSQHIGGNVSLNRTALSLIFWVHLSLIVWCRLCVIAFMLD